MTNSVQKTLRDSAATRWMVLFFLAFAMFCSYIFMDILSPIIHGDGTLPHSEQCKALKRSLTYSCFSSSSPE